MRVKDDVLPEKGSCKWGGREIWDPVWRFLYRSAETGQSDKEDK